MTSALCTWLSPVASLISAVVVKSLPPAKAILAALLTSGLGGAVEPPAYVPDSAVLENGCPDCCVKTPKLTAASVPMMNAWLVPTRYMTGSEFWKPEVARVVRPVLGSTVYVPALLLGDDRMPPLFWSEAKLKPPVP